MVKVTFHLSGDLCIYKGRQLQSAGEVLGAPAPALTDRTEGGEMVVRRTPRALSVYPESFSMLC